MPDGEMKIRDATVADLDEILRHRSGMYEDMGYDDAQVLTSLVSTSTPYFAKALTEGSFRGWLAEIEGRVVGGGGVLISPWPSHPYDLECRRATILNVYTYPEFRRKGIARRVMEVILNWLRKQGYAAVWLHASEHGRSLYEDLGFEPGNEMRLMLR